jgi:hypothetical protein
LVLGEGEGSGSSDPLIYVKRSERFAHGADCERRQEAAHSDAGRSVNNDGAPPGLTGGLDFICLRAQ